MKKYAISIILLCIATVAFSQNAPIPEAEAARQNLKTLSDNNSITGVINSFDGRYEGIKGNPYYSLTWDKAFLSIQNSVFENIHVKYNVYDNSIHFKNSKGNEMVIDANKVSKFTTVDSVTQLPQTFVKTTLLGDFETSLLNKFALIIYEGKQHQLVMVPEKKLLKADYKGPYSSGRNYDEFIDKNSYYIIQNGKPAVVKLNKKNLITRLSDKKIKIESFIKKEKIDAGTEKGWAQTLAYYETL